MYQEWLSEPSPRLLRIVGYPGVGKTSVFAFLVGQLQKMARARCGGSRAALPATICKAIFLWDILVTLLAEQEDDEIFILIDALDECNRAGDLAFALHHLASSWTQKDIRVKFLITYRPEYYLYKILDNIGLNLRIDADNSLGLDIYIDTRVKNLSSRLFSRVGKEVSTMLKENAHGNFLWVSLVFDNLERAMTLRHVRKILDNPPKSLEELYENAFLRIGEEYHNDALSVLQWVVGAQRPLTTDELAVALAMGDGYLDPDTVLSEDAIEESKDLFRICGSFVNLGPESKTLRLIHLSVRDYLLTNLFPKHQIRENELNRHIMDTCLRFLRIENQKIGQQFMYQDISNTSSESRRIALREHLSTAHFLEYAVFQWSKHARAVDSRVLQTYEWDTFFFGNNGQFLDSWVRLYWAYVRPLEDPPGFQAIHVAGFFGLESLLLWLLNNSGSSSLLDIDQKDLTGGTALHWAATNGHVLVLSILIDKGANPNSTDRTGRTPLMMAAMNGHGDVLTVLLHYFPDARNVGDVNNRTLLSLAAMNGHAAVVSTLLDSKVQVELIDTRRESCFDEGADYSLYLEPDDEDQGSSRPDHVKVIRMLYEADADINAKDVSDSTALHYAVKEPNHTLEQCLIELGADVNIGNADRKSPAQLAWERKSLNWSLYEVDKEETDLLSPGGNSEVAVLYKTDDAYKAHEKIFRKTITVPKANEKKQPTPAQKKSASQVQKEKMMEIKRQQLEEKRLQMQKYLIRERDLLQKLDHPHIVSYLGYEEDPDADTYTLYLEFCNAMDLSGYRNSNGDDDAALKESEIWEFIFYLAAALAYCHHGLSLKNYQFDFELDWLHVLHRDIKPQNVALHEPLNERRILKLCDLGISKDSTYAENTSLNATAGFKAPESPDEWTIKSDIYSFGATFDSLNIPKRSDDLISLLKESMNQSEPSMRPSSFDILQVAWQHLNDDLKQLYNSLPRLLGQPSERFLLNAYLHVTKRLDFNFPLESRVARERRRKWLDRLLLLEKDGAGVLFEQHGGSLHVAALLGQDAKVKSLLQISQHGDIDERWPESGWTPLHLAAQSGSFTIAILLIEYGANIGLKDNFGRLPYFYADLGGYEWAISLVPDPMRTR